MARKTANKHHDATQGSVAGDSKENENAPQIETMYRSMMETLPDMIAMLDLNYCYIAFNRAYHSESQRIFGIDLKVGDSMIEALAHLPKEQKGAAEFFGRAIGGEDYTVSHEFGDEHRTRRVYQIHFFPLRDAAGRIIGGAHIARDITDQKRAEDELRRSEEEFRHFFESSGGGKAQLDPNTERFLRVNDMYCKLTGYSREELLGMTFAEVTLPEDRERDLRLYRQVRDSSAGEYASDKRYLRKDGTVRWVQVTVGFLRDDTGKAYRSLAVIQDITGLKQIEQDLRTSEERFRRLVESSTVGLAITNVYGKVLYSNDAVHAITGYSAEDVSQLNWINLTPPEYLDRDLRAIEQVRAAGTCTPYEKELITKDGRRVPVLLGVTMIDRDETGEPIGACFITDLTRLKQAEEAQQRFRLALDSAPDNMFLIDPETLRFLDVNQSSCRDLGYSREELLQLSPLAIMRHLSVDEIQTLFAEIRSNPSAKGTLETMHYRKDGTCYEVEKILRLVEVQGRPVMVGVARDITERKRAEQALREANDRLAEADRRKDEFLAMLAHELRNPLAPIRNAVQVLRLKGNLDQVSVRQRDIIDRQVSHMARLLGDLLDVSRITYGKIQFNMQPLTLAEVLEHAIETVRPLIESRQQTLHVTPPSTELRIRGDLDRLAQAIGNLLTNAAKYTAEGGRIWVEAFAEDKQAVVRIRDTGIGIAPEMLPRIFDLFAQADQGLAHAQGGLGIGLTLVRTMVQMHGGLVEAHSPGLGQGSEFIIRLPAMGGLTATNPTDSGQTRDRIS